jgi:hypothetical protein
LWGAGLAPRVVAKHSHWSSVVVCEWSRCLAMRRRRQPLPLPIGAIFVAALYRFFGNGQKEPAKRPTRVWCSKSVAGLVGVVCGAHTSKSRGQQQTVEFTLAVDTSAGCCGLRMFCSPADHRQGSRNNKQHTQRPPCNLLAKKGTKIRKTLDEHSNNLTRCWVAWKRVCSGWDTLVRSLFTPEHDRSTFPTTQAHVGSHTHGHDV